jgi:hypothetical protein
VTRPRVLGHPSGTYSIEPSIRRMVCPQVGPIARGGKHPTRQAQNDRVRDPDGSRHTRKGREMHPGGDRADLVRLARSGVGPLVHQRGQLQRTLGMNPGARVD